MRTRNSNFLNNSSVTIPKRRNKRRAPNVVEPELRTIVEVAPMADNRTIEELLQEPTKGYEEAIVIPEIKERFKEMLKACPHHIFTELTQIDTFYNGLNENDQDSLNDMAGGNLLSKTTREALNIIENKSKVRYSRNKPNVSMMNTTPRENSSKTDDRIDKLTDQISTLVDIVSKKVVTLVTVKAVEKFCVTCGGDHAYYNCDATNSNQLSVCAATSTYNQVIPQNRASNHMAPPGFAPMQNSQNSISKQEENLRKNLNDDMRSILGSFFQNQALTSGTLPSNTILNPKAYEGPLIPTPKKVVERETEETTSKEQPNCQGSIAHIQPPVVPTPIPEPVVPTPIPEPVKLSLPELTPTRMTLELADRSITRPKGVAKDVSVKVGKFYFPTDFVVFDFEANPQVPLILGRSFLRTDHALIDVYGEEITLRVNDEAITFNLNQTTRYSSTYDDMSENRIDVIDVFRNCFILEEIEAYLKDDLVSPEINHANCDPEGDICLIEKLLNNDPLQLPLMDLKQEEVAKAKYSIEEPPELELKDLPSHLEYAYLEGVDKLPVIITKGLKDDEKSPLKGA
nr:reverse transcriptase domain-containing protein [Tanacetum cinerariifolium]